MISKVKSLSTSFGFSVFICYVVDSKNMETLSTRKLDSENEVQEIWKIGLEEHNRYRQNHGISPLQGSLQLHKDAQNHADYLAKMNKVELSPYTQYGENLATSYQPNKLDVVRDVVKRWYNRLVFFDFENPEQNRTRPSSGPFCSIVWKSTKYMGIGVAWNKYENKWVVVVLYDPDANGINFRENIPRPKKFDIENMLDLFVNLFGKSSSLKNK